MELVEVNYKHVILIVIAHINLIQLIVQLKKQEKHMFLANKSIIHHLHRLHLEYV
jgi:hypothetical protein